MDLSISPAELAFRENVRKRIADQLKPEWRAVGELSSRHTPELSKAWQQVMAAQGWLTANWPPEYGGQPWTPMQHYILNCELDTAKAPAFPQMEFGMVAPMIYTFGTKAQKDFFLPRLLSGEDTWCQGFSEPASGSDLASLKTSARLEGDEYVINGQKTWTSFAHRATQMFGLFRTDPDAVRPQAGISMILVPMGTPGITVRPIHSIDGAHHFNEVFFDDARVPAQALLGEVHKGWDVARFLLSHERSGIAEVQATAGIISDISAIVDAEQDRELAMQLSDLQIRLESLEMLELRLMDGTASGKSLGHEASLLKISGAELRQDALMLGLAALGPLAEAAPSDNAPLHPTGKGKYFATDSLFYRAISIYGGTNEIQRTIIAKALLRSNGGI